MSERPAVQAILAERDPGELVRMWVDLQLDAATRGAQMGAVVMAAADVDDDARALRDLIRRETLAGATAFVTHLAGAGGLRPSLSVERAADACWALVNSLLPHLLMDTRGWPAREYAEWLVRVTSATLLDPDRPVPARSTPAVRVVPEPAHERYQALVDGKTAGHLSYQQTERLVLLTRTSVEAGAADGVADALVRRALDDLQADGSRRVVPLCDYVSWWISRHPDYAALVYDAATG
jgi:predicted GNAT family acetyltransferase